MESEPMSHLIDLQAAAGLVSLPPDVLEALVRGGYLTAGSGSGASRDDGEPGAGGDRGSAPPGLSFDLADLKAFVARNADNGANGGLLDRALGTGPEWAVPAPTGGSAPLEPQELFHLLDDRAEQMAQRVLRIYSAVFPEAAAWSARERSSFVAQTKSRFESILALSERGGSTDRELQEELRQIGRSAARSGAPLVNLLDLVRMSRDLVVQNAVELAQADGRQGGVALSLLLTRILPAMDHLGDALAKGYFDAIGPQAGASGTE